MKSYEQILRVFLLVVCITTTATPFLCLVTENQECADSPFEDAEPYHMNVDISQTLNQPLIERSVSYANFKLVEITAKSSVEATPSRNIASIDGVSESAQTIKHIAGSMLPPVLFELNSSDGFQIWESNHRQMKALVNPSIYLMLTNLTSLNVELLHPNIQELIERETFDIMHSKSLKSKGNNLVI